MKKMYQAPFLALLVALMFGLSKDATGQAQATATQRGEATAADRGRVADAITKGDYASAEKIITNLQSAAAAPQASGSVLYEEIKACGFYPQETRLECVVEIKQTGGYAGPVGSTGSMEHVYFCVDWNDDGIFSQVESVGQGSVEMHDESAGAPPTWHYAVYRDINPPGGPRTSNTGNITTTVTNGPTRRAKAILSWVSPPTGCSFTPVWGNVFNFRIRLDPIR